MRACKCDFLNKITFQPGLSNTLYLHIFLYTAKSMYIHYHSGYPLKALEKGLEFNNEKKTYPRSHS